MFGLIAIRYFLLTLALLFLPSIPFQYKHVPLKLIQRRRFTNLRMVLNIANTSSVATSGEMKAAERFRNHSPCSILTEFWNAVFKLKKIANAVRGFDKESNRKFRRTIFVTEDWKKHRRSDRYFKELFKMPYSLVLRGISLQAFGVCFWSLLIVGYNILVEKILQTKLWPVLSFPSLPLSLTSPSLGLLLVFRTNAAYSRWMSGRSSWAVIRSKSFDLMRQTMLWIDDKELKLAIMRHIVTFPLCLKWYLGQKGNDKRLHDDLMGILTKSELEQLMRSRDRIQYCLFRLSQLMTQANLIPNIQNHMDKGVCSLTDQAFECQKVFNTPIPLMYTRHTARFLLLWLLSVPMALYHELQSFSSWGIVFTIPLISFLHAIFLFGIEDLGVQIEEPFSILPLADICKDIRLSAEDMMKDQGLENWRTEPSSSNNNNNNSSSGSSFVAAQISDNVENVAGGVSGVNAPEPTQLIPKSGKSSSPVTVERALAESSSMVAVTMPARSDYIARAKEQVASAVASISFETQLNPPAASPSVNSSAATCSPETFELLQATKPSSSTARPDDAAAAAADAGLMGELLVDQRIPWDPRNNSKHA